MHREPMMDDQSLKSHMPDAMMSIPDGTLDLGWGHQSSGLHPVEAIRNVARGVLESNGLVALQYGPEQGVRYGRVGGVVLGVKEEEDFCDFSTSSTRHLL